MVCRHAPTRTRMVSGAPQCAIGPSHAQARSRAVVCITTSPVAAETYTSVVRELGGLERVLTKLEEPSTPASQAAALEFVLEGLHLSKRLNKTPVDGSSIYGG